MSLFDRPLEDWQTASPVLHLRPGVEGLARRLGTVELAGVFTRPGNALHTFGHASGRKRTEDPHWLAISGPLPPHTDISYPRYTHQLMVRGDYGVVLNGRDRVDHAVETGTYLVLDTHSPHQVRHLDRTARYYIAAVIDADEQLPEEDTLPALLEYANTAPFELPR